MHTSKRLMIALLVIGVLSFSRLASVARAGDELTIDQVPPVVKDTILKAAGEFEVKDIEATTKDGKKVYEVDWMDGGQEIKLWVASDGTIVEKGLGDEKIGEEEKDADKKNDQNKEDDEDDDDDDEKEEAEAADFTENFDLDSRNLVSQGKNKFFVLEPGYQLILQNDEDKLIVTVLKETKKIGNVETRVVEERELEDGKLVEVSRNFFAIDSKSNDVFYFGEEVDIYKDGKIVKHEGAWEAGSDGAKAGLIMPGTILLGARYYQEQAPGKAMDRAAVVSDSETFTTPAGSFKNCLKTAESSALEKGKESKLYAPGIGLIQDEDLLLTYYGPAKEDKAEATKAKP